MGCDSARGSARPPVEKIGGSGKGLGPERGRRVCVEQHSANAVVQGAEDALRLAVLSRRVRAREAESNTIVLEKLAKNKVIEFTAIVCLKAKDGQLKLPVDIRTEGNKGGSDIRFMHERESPNVMRVVIYNHQIKFVP